MLELDFSKNSSSQTSQVRREVVLPGGGTSDLLTHGPDVSAAYDVERWDILP